MEEYWLSERSRAAWSLRETEQKIAQCNEDLLAYMRGGLEKEALKEQERLGALMRQRECYINAYRDADGEVTRAAWFRLTGI